MLNKSKRNKNTKKADVVKKCVECDSTGFHTDYKLNEISCLKCGLVLYAPYSADFIVDGFKLERINMLSEKLEKRIKKLEDESEIKITKRYIDSDDTIFDVATYIYENIDCSFFIIECELKYTSDIFSKVYNYSFEVESVNDNRITNFNIKKNLKQKIGSILDDIGYTNNIQLENHIKKIVIEKK